MDIGHWWEPRRLVIPLAIAAIFVLALGPLIDPDLFWHLANGRLILETRSIPRADPFSFTMAGKEWVCHEWLTEVSMYALYQWLGPVALMIAGAAVIAASLGLVALRSRSTPFLAAACALLAMLASAPILGVRPQMLSLLLASLTLHIVEGGAPLWTLVPLSALWANLHGGFFTAAAIVGACWLGTAIDTLVLKQGDRTAGLQRLKRLALVAAGTLLPPAINPYGIKLLTYSLQTLASGAMRAHITEWLSLDFHKLAFQPLALLLLALMAALALARKRPSTTHLLLLLGTSYAALNSARHVPLFALVAAPVLCEQLAALQPARRARRALPAAGQPEQRTAPRLVGITFALLVAACVVAGVVWRVQSVVAVNEAAQSARYPLRAMDALRQAGTAGNLYNAYNWGGYLIWQGEKVFIDGRADVYGDEFFNQHIRIYYGKALPAETLNQYRIGRVLIERDSVLATLLSADAAWKTAYRDDLAVLFVRTESN